MMDSQNSLINVSFGFTEDEREAVLDIAYKCFGAKFTWIYQKKEEDIRAFLCEKLVPEDTLVARRGSNNEIVGFCKLVFSTSPKASKSLTAIKNKAGFFRKGFLGLFDHQSKADECYILHIGTKENTRGQGIGKAMLDYSNKVAEERQLKRITLHVIIENEGAKRLYNREGFTDIKTSKFGWFLRQVFYFKGVHFLEKTVEQVSQEKEGIPN